MTRIEGLDLDANPQIGHAARHFTQHAGGVGHHIVGLSEIHRAAVERGDFGQAGLKVRDPLRRRDHVGALLAQGQRRVSGAKDNIASHSGGEVDHDIGIRLPYALHHLAVKVHGAIRGARFRVAHVAVHHRGTRFGRIDRRARDLLGAAWHLVAAVLCAARTG